MSSPRFPRCSRGIYLPLAKELGETDRAHDGLGGAIWYLTEAYLRHPTIDPEVKEAARRVRKAFIPALSELQASYPDEALSAKQRRGSLDEWKSDLERFPVAGGETETLLGWAEAFLDRGNALDDLLSERATQTAVAGESSRSSAMALRSSTIGLVGRCRSALADEMAVNKDLPKNLDALVFGYFDELARLREQSDKSSSPSGGGAPPDSPPAS